MRKICVLLLVFFQVLYINAQELVQNNEDTKVDFKIKNLGFYVDGTFSDISITSNFNSNNLSNSYIKGIVKVNTINTDNNKRDAHLRRADFFDVVNYEFIELESIEFEKETQNKYKLIAKLTIKKVTKTIVIPIEIVETKNSIRLTANFDINRLDYEVGESSFVMSDTVKIEIIYSGKK